MKNIFIILISVLFLCACTSDGGSSSGDPSSSNGNNRGSKRSGGKNKDGKVTVLCKCDDGSLIGRGDDEDSAKEKAKKRCDRKRGTLSDCEQADI